MNNELTLSLRPQHCSEFFRQLGKYFLLYFIDLFVREGVFGRLIDEAVG
jgi:hypothetical protein